MGLILTIMANGTLSTHPDEPTVHPEATVGHLVADKMCVGGSPGWHPRGPGIS